MPSGRCVKSPMCNWESRRTSIATPANEEETGVQIRWPKRPPFEAKQQPGNQLVQRFAQGDHFRFYSSLYVQG